jgi:hypothetical protein
MFVSHTRLQWWCGRLPVSASVSDDHQQRTSVPFSGGCKSTLRSVRLISMMQDSNAVTVYRHGCRWWCAQRRKPTDRMTMTRVSLSINACITPSPSIPYSFPPLSSAPTYGSVLQKCLRSEYSPQPFSFFSDTACVPPSQPRPSSDFSACTSNFCRHISTSMPYTS